MMEKTQIPEIKKLVGIRLRASLVNRLKEIAEAENIRHYQTLIDTIRIVFLADPYSCFSSLDV